MAFQVSPGINVSEIDLSAVIPAVSSTEGAIVGVFQKGPINTRVLVDSEATLVNRFGKPNANNFETFFTAASFLAYGNKLYVTRVVPSDANTASVEGNAALIESRTDAEALSTNGPFIAQNPGILGNSLMVSTCYDSDDYSAAITIEAVVVGNTQMTISNTEVTSTSLAVNDIIRVGNSAIGFQDLTVTAVGSDSGGEHVVTFTPKYALSANSPTSATRYWKYYNNVDGAPSGSNSHIVVVDENGLITGVSNTVLEVYENVSRTAGDLSEDGTNIYYRDKINESSNYIWATGTAITDSVNYQSLSGGTDGTNGTESTIPVGRLALGYDLYASPEDVDISLFLAGKANTTLANYIIDNVAERRKDCVVFISPERTDVVEQSTGSELAQVIAFGDALTASSYAVVDSGYKYTYDKYNDLYRYVPLNGDIAGLCVRTDSIRDPWFSPAGYTRGIIKNVVKLAWNPKKADRDQLYQKYINPVISQPGQGTLLFGDKTKLGKATAFDRINVRRLFIILEKAIAAAAKLQLFEFNDEVTRASFRNIVEPFLRDIQGRRGIYEFRVVCDETNNTSEIIDTNRFVGDIYVKPAKSINFIQLNFVAVRSSVEFDEIVQRF